MTNTAILQQANALITQGDNEGFLAFCAEDIVWSVVGGETLMGKAAVRDWMQANYVEPPTFTVEAMVAEGDYVVALGEIDSQDTDGHRIHSRYSDVWRFRDGLMVELKAFVIELGG